jgi:magnesium transporter
MPAPVSSDLKHEVSNLLAQKSYVALRQKLAPALAQDFAPILADLPLADLAILFRYCSKELAVAIFSYLDHEAKHRLLKALTQEQEAMLLEELPPDDRTHFLNELPEDVASQLMCLLSPEERLIAQELLAYPEHSVGRLMTLDFVAVHPDWTVLQSLEFIRRHGFDRETLSMVYVTDEQGRLIDDIRVRRFLLANPETPVRVLMDGNFVSLHPTDDRKKALEIFRQFDRVALPVVNDENKLIGIVTADDMLDVASELTTEAIQKIGGTEALDEPYITIPLHRMIRKRAGWLVALFLSEMLTTTAMTHFSDELDKAVVLALFIPLAMSSGGNSGSQASTLAIRAMALGEFKLREWWKVLRRELVVGLSLGCILGVIGFLRVTVWSLAELHFTGKTDYGIQTWPYVAATVGTALIGIVLWGSVMGAMLPLIIKRCGLDPAVSSAPLVATLVDVTGIIIYFNVAAFILMKHLPS